MIELPFPGKVSTRKGELLTIHSVNDYHSQHEFETPATPSRAEPP